MIIKPQFLLAALWLQFIACGQQQTSSTPKHRVQYQLRTGADSPTVDHVTYQAARKLNANDIKEFRITGTQFMRFDNNPIIITDKQEMNRYITALRHAVGRPQRALNGIDRLEIIFFPRKGKPVESQVYNFNLLNDLDCFGPEFHKLALTLQARIAQKDKSAQATHKSSP